MGGQEGVLPETASLAYRARQDMHTQNGNLAIAEPPVRTASAVSRDRGLERDEVQPSDLTMLRERVKRMRMPRGECVPGIDR
jgi:hypothetical protein